MSTVYVDEYGSVQTVSLRKQQTPLIMQQEKKGESDAMDVFKSKDNLALHIQTLSRLLRPELNKQDRHNLVAYLYKKVDKMPAHLKSFRNMSQFNRCLQELITEYTIEDDKA